MYKTRKELKLSAKKALYQKWGTAIPMTLILVLVNISFSTNYNNVFSMTFSPLIASILATLLEVGMYSFFFKLLCGQKDSANFMDLFYGFKNAPGKAILLSLLRSLYLLPGAIVYGVVVSVSIFCVYFSAGIPMEQMLRGNVAINTSLLLITFAITIVMSILFCIYSAYVSSTYSMIYYILLDYPDLSVSEIWKHSKQLMKGNRIRYISLILSFFPWFMLCMFTLGVGLLWLTPYIETTSVAFYIDLVQKRPTAASNNAAAPVKDVTDYSGINQDTFK